MANKLNPSVIAEYDRPSALIFVKSIAETVDILKLL
jgi:hypothetical protein